MARNDRVAIISSCHRERAHARENGMQLAWGVRGNMQHNKNRGRECRGQAGDHGLQGCDATSGGTYDDNISVSHTSLFL